MSANNRYRFVNPSSFNVPRNHVHELVKIIKIVHRFENQAPDVPANFVDAGGSAHVVQDILPATVVIELASGQTCVFQHKRRPDVLELERPVP